MTARRGMKQFVGLIAFSALCLMLAGCGNKASNLPPLGKVHGKLTFKGQPVADARVEFRPDDTKGTMGPSSSGTTDAEGNFTLMTNTGKGRGDKVEGAMVGFHVIRIVPPDPALDPEPKPKRVTIPFKYLTAETSGLTAEVKQGEDNEIHFDLKP